MATYVETDRLNPKLFNSSWLISTAYPRHMARNLSLLSNLQPIEPFTVGLTNGSKLVAKMVGSVVLANNLRLDNVLYTPELNCNLISAIQICRDYNYGVEIGYNGCVIYDRTTKELIGKAEDIDGLCFWPTAPEAPPRAVSKEERLNSSWMISTGAPHHMAGNLALLSNPQPIEPFTLDLPSATVVVTKKGSVVLSNNLRLDHVLYAPTLNCNLISVPQLSSDYDCEFANRKCLIRDRTTRKLIATGEMFDGLYLFAA